MIILGGAGRLRNCNTEIIDMGADNAQLDSRAEHVAATNRTECGYSARPQGAGVGGSVNDEDATTESLNADLFDPGHNSISSAGANAYAAPLPFERIALPDATVWFAGGNPVRGSYEHHVEIYKPAYLFNADGTLAPRGPRSRVFRRTIAWGGSFTVSTPDAANISSVVLIRPGAPTHAFDMDQRVVAMSFTKGSGTLTVTAPPNGNIAPPGYYMVFLLNNSGVPSVAKFTKLGAGLPAPTVSSISPLQGRSTAEPRSPLRVRTSGAGPR